MTSFFQTKCDMGLNLVKVSSTSADWAAQWPAAWQQKRWWSCLGHSPLTKKLFFGFLVLLFSWGLTPKAQSFSCLLTMLKVALCCCTGLEWMQWQFLNSHSDSFSHFRCLCEACFFLFVCFVCYWCSIHIHQITLNITISTFTKFLFSVTSQWRGSDRRRVWNKH